MKLCAVTSDFPIGDRTLEACQRGDSEGFRLLFEVYKDRVYSIALYYFSGRLSITWISERAKMNARGTLTLWYLVPRFREPLRALVIEPTAALAPLPQTVMRAGVMALDANIMDAWKAELEQVWQRKSNI